MMDDVTGRYLGGTPVQPTPAEGGATLHLGVLVQPYRARGKLKSGKVAAPVDTGQVAQWLEKRYGAMAAFVRVKENLIVGSIEQSVENAIEVLLKTGRAIPAFSEGTGAIESAFRDFIDSQEVERVGIPGLPSQAALRGVNHRLAHPYRSSNPRRPSLKDTGLYARSFRAWVD